MIPVLAILAALCGGLGYYCRWWVKKQTAAAPEKEVESPHD
jgi:hypothetical protein